jgi:hypothetical protein
MAEYSVMASTEATARTVRADADGAVVFEQNMVPPSCDLTIQRKNGV